MRPKSVSEYIATAPQQGQKKLREMRALLKKVVPKATEAVKWGAPVFIEKRILFAYAAYTSHLGFMPTPSTLRAFTKELASYKTGKGSIQFPYDKPLPTTLIRKIATYRAKELREKDAKWM